MPREMEELEKKLNEYKKHPIDHDSVMRQVDEIKRNLDEKEEEAKQLKSLSQAIFAQERKSNTENLFQMREIEGLEKKLNEYKKHPIDHDSVMRQVDEIKRNLDEKEEEAKQLKSLSQAIFTQERKSNTENLFQMREIEGLEKKLNENKKNPIDDDSVMRQVDEIRKCLIESEETRKQLESLYQAAFAQELKSKL